MASAMYQLACLLGEKFEAVLNWRTNADARRLRDLVRLGVRVQLVKKPNERTFVTERGTRWKVDG